MKTKVVHSESKDAWNIVSDTIGTKYKIGNAVLDTKNKSEALRHALFISNALKDYK